MRPQDAILEIINRAYQIEVDGYTFYSMTAERASQDAVQELFGKLAADELQHQAFLKNVATHFDEKGVGAFVFARRTPDVGALTSQVFTGRFRAQAAGAQFETAVLSIGMTLESNAIKYFSSAATQATDKGVEDFYQFLASWEKQHFDALQNLYNLVREDHMAQSGFSPF